MARDDSTPLAAVGRGLLAGVAGTAAMTVYQGLVARLQRRSGDLGSNSQQDPWERASAPAKVGRRLIEAVLQTKLGPQWIPVRRDAARDRGAVRVPRVTDRGLRRRALRRVGMTPPCRSPSPVMRLDWKEARRRKAAFAHPASAGPLRALSISDQYWHYYGG
jgi:hypothetical protein